MDRASCAFSITVASDVSQEGGFRGQTTQITVAALPAVDSLSAASEVTAGQVSGMEKGGFVNESVTDIEVSGFPAKQIVGEFRSDAYEGAYSVDTKVVFTDEATVTISVSVYDDDSNGEIGVVPARVRLGVSSW